MTQASIAGGQQHGQQLVDTMAFEGAADVVGLLADKTLYAVYGDHGGAQKDVQRIPMAFYAKGIEAERSYAGIPAGRHHADGPRSMGITADGAMDGRRTSYLISESEQAI